jgi:hypothetical protein
MTTQPVNLTDYSMRSRAGRTTQNPFGSMHSRSFDGFPARDGPGVEGGSRSEIFERPASLSVRHGTPFEGD